MSRKFYFLSILTFFGMGYYAGIVHETRPMYVWLVLLSIALGILVGWLTECLK